MRGLDTNVLLRLTTGDDPDQVRRARAVLDAAAAEGERFLVTTVALCELAWTLRGRPYGLSRAAVAKVLDQLLSTRLFEIQDSDVVHRAVASFRQGRADFADYLLGHLSLRAGCTDVLTFDGKLAEEAGFSELPS